MSVEGMPTPEELEEVFEVPKSFAEEAPEQTWARFDWLRTRQEAEFLLFLTRKSLGLSLEQLRDIYGAFNFAVGDYNDFVAVGCHIEPGTDYDYVPHPLSSVIAELTLSVEDGLDELVVKKDPHKYILEGYGGDFEEIGALEDEEIIHKLTKLQKKYPVEDE